MLFIFSSKLFSFSRYFCLEILSDRMKVSPVNCPQEDCLPTLIQGEFVGGGNLPGDNFPVTRKNDLIRKIRLILKIYYVTTWLTNNYKTQWQPDFFFLKKKTLGVCLLLSFNMIRHSSTWHAIKNSIKLFDY